MLIESGCAGPAPSDAAVGEGLRAPPSPPPTESPEAAYSLGVDFLVSTQNDDGSWGSFESSRPSEIWLGTIASHRAFRDATTALCVMALQEPSQTNEPARTALSRGLSYLLGAQPVGRATGEVFYGIWTHTYVVHALSKLHRDERFATQRDEIAAVVRREIDILAANQGANGGWGYYDFGHSLSTPTGAQSTSFNTASVLIALHEAQQAGFNVDPDLIHDGLRFLERMRVPSGAYLYGISAEMRPGALFNRVKGSLGRSQSCNLALWLLGRDITRDELLAGARNLREQHHFIEIGKGRPYPHEAWYQTAGYYFLFGHYYAALVIDELAPADRAEYGAWLARTMHRLQDDDGSWFDFPLYGYHKAYGTAYAVMTLEVCLREQRDAPAAADILRGE